jgi:hypothetical protein
MSHRNPPFLRRPQPGAKKLTPADRHTIEVMASMSAAIMEICGKDLGLSDEEIRTTPQAARDLWTGFIADQRANGNHP